MTPPPDDPDPGRRQRSVLIAEDNGSNQELLRDYMLAWGCTVYTAWDGAEAVAAADAHRLDLIIMDIQMPRLDGIEAIRQIRARPEHAGVPIIALTALAMAGDRERCLAVGADAYISKPAELRSLRALAERLMAEGRPAGDQ